MSVTLERAWAICALLEAADAERHDSEMERAWFLTEPAPAPPPLPAPPPPKAAKLPRPSKPKIPKQAKPRKPAPRREPTPKRIRTERGKPVARQVPSLGPDAAERLRLRRRARLGLDS